MDRTYLRQAVGLVALSTVVLTAAFVGVVALGQGGPPARSTASVLRARGRRRLRHDAGHARGPREGGVPILTSTVAVTVIGFALLALGGEGVIYRAQDPGRLGTGRRLLRRGRCRLHRQRLHGG